MSERDDCIVTLNIGGIRYQTFKSVLRSMPNTLLGNMFSEANSSLLQEKDEYFFDRNGRLFEYIIDTYRNGGNIILPSDASEIERVLQEFQYWGIVIPPPSEPVYDTATMLPHDEDTNDPSLCMLLLTGNDANRFFAILSALSTILDDINIIVDRESVIVEAMEDFQLAQISLKVPASCFAANSRWCSVTIQFGLADFSSLATRYCAESIVGFKIVLFDKHVCLLLQFENGAKLHVKKTLPENRSVRRVCIGEIPLLCSVQFESVLPFTNFLRFRTKSVAMTFCDNLAHLMIRKDNDTFIGTFACVHKFGPAMRCPLWLHYDILQKFFQQVAKSQFRLGIDVKGEHDDGNNLEHSRLVQFSFTYDNQPADFQFILSIVEMQED